MIDKNENAILEELRKQTALFQRVHKINIIAYFILGILIITLVAFPIAYKLRKPSRIPLPMQVEDSWSEARNLIDKGNLASGIEMTKRLINKNPEYYYGYALLASAYQEMGEWKKTEGGGSALDKGHNR